MKYLGNPQSGSQANTTASHNRAGQYLRNRRVPVVPTRTPKQALVRGQFGSVSAAWQSLTTAQQNAWTSFAEAYPITDALGQSVTLTGHQYFIGVSTQLLQCGQSVVNTPPTNTSVQPLTPVTTYADISGFIFATYAHAVGGDFVKMSASPIRSGGVSFNKQMSLFGVETGGNGYNEIGVRYVAQYGSPNIGQTIFVGLTYVNSSGMSGNIVIVKTPVVDNSSLTPPTLTSVLAGNVTVTSADPGLTAAYVETGPTNVGPWTGFEYDNAFVSPAIYTGLTSGSYARARVFNGAVWSAPSAAQVIT